MAAKQKKEKNQNKEILWNIVNSCLAGALVFLGGCSTGHITLETIVFSLVAGATAAVVQFKDYWMKEQKEYNTKLFKFL